jgi:transcriptional regulator with XRE-family HTH domain
MDLRTLRKKRGLKVDALALIAGVDQGTISRIERGLVQARPDTVLRIAQGLGISVQRARKICDAAWLANMKAPTVSAIEDEAEAVDAKPQP